jgi:hypothetical protein
VGNGTVRSEWNFDDTIRGTIAGMPIELDLGALDDEEEEWDLENEEVEVWDGTMRIKEGSVIGGDLNTLNVSTSSSGVVNTDDRLRQCPYQCWTVPTSVQPPSDLPHRLPPKVWNRDHRQPALHPVNRHGEKGKIHEEQ